MSDPTAAPGAHSTGEMDSSLSVPSRRYQGSPEERNVPLSEAELLGDHHLGFEPHASATESFVNQKQSLVKENRIAFIFFKRFLRLFTN